MQRDAVKEKSEAFTLYEMDDRFIPVSQSTTDQGTAIYGQLEKWGKDTTESGSFGLHLDFARAFGNKMEAIEAAKKKWGSKIKIDPVKLDRQYSIVEDAAGPVAVKEALVSQKDKTAVEEITRPLRQGSLGDQDTPYAIAAIEGNLQKGVYSQKTCSYADYKGLLKEQIIPLPTAVKFDLIRERQSRYNAKPLLPEADQNIVGKAQINKDLMNSDDWLKAKAGDIAAARRVVDALWSEKKTAQLKELIGEPGDKVFVTMPSTSRFNVLPKAMAQKLKREFDGKIKVISGDEYFNLTHNAEVKNISRFDRVFYERKYRTEKPFDKSLEGKKAILIDDVFTTGGSVKAFSRELSDKKLNVTNVVGLMGDKRFNVDKKTEQKLKETLKDTGIAADTSRLKSLLTRTEAGMLIQRLNREKGLKNEKHRELTKRIQGFYKGIFVKNTIRNRDGARDNSPGRSHRNNGKDAQRVQNRGARGGRGR